MDETVQKFLRNAGPVLCVDIGSGTQDALLARPGLEGENWPRFVLPAACSFSVFASIGPALRAGR